MEPFKLTPPTKKAASEKRTKQCNFKVTEAKYAEYMTARDKYGFSGVPVLLEEMVERGLQASEGKDITVKEKVVEKIVEKPVEKIVYKDKIVEKPVEKIVEKVVYKEGNFFTPEAMEKIKELHERRKADGKKETLQEMLMKAFDYWRKWS